MGEEKHLSGNKYLITTPEMLTSYDYKRDGYGFPIRDEHGNKVVIEVPYRGEYELSTYGYHAIEVREDVQV